MFFTLKSVITGVFESIYLILMEFLTWIIYVGSNFFFLGIPASLVMDFLLDKVHLNKPLKIITGMIVYSITGAFLLLVFIVVLDYRDILYKRAAVSISLAGNVDLRCACRSAVFYLVQLVMDRFFKPANMKPQLSK